MWITNNYKLETPNGISYRGGVFEFHLPHSRVCYFNPCGFKNSCSQRDSDDHSQMIQMWNHELLAYKVKTCPFLSYVKPPTLRLNHAWVEVGHRSVLYKMNCAWKRIVDSIILTLEHISTGRMIWENFLPMKLRVSGLLVLNGNPSWANHVENGIYTTVVLW